MATKEDKQLLIDTLKFTPRTYKISMWGYGGEKVMGTVDRAAWDYCMENQVDLSDIAFNSDAAEEIVLDADQLPFYPGQWHECDNMAHVNGVSRDAGTIQIVDENSETVFEKSLDDCDGCDNSPQWSCQDEVWIGSRKQGEIVFVGSSNEKGTFFEGEIALTAPFNVELLELQYDEVDGEEIVNSVCYDGEEIENWGGSTDGKSSDFTMCLITDDEGNFERYDPGEKDWGHPEYGTSPGQWESSKTFQFKKQKPTITGYYSCNYRRGSTYGCLYWDGQNFGDWEYGKFNVESDAGIVSWSGYNWDTTDWANQPPEPVDVVCDNKICNWTGMGSTRREDDDYNSHCPECDGIEFSWIDYDPNTKEGCANRKKYCLPVVKDSLFELDENVSIDLNQGLGSEQDIELAMTDWYPGHIDPVHQGTYLIQLAPLLAWPFPTEAMFTWTGKTWKNVDGKAVGKVFQWRGLQESAT